MIVSVNIADVGVTAALGLLARPPRPASVPGLRHLDLGIAAPLSGSLRKSPALGRIGMYGFWDDEAALDAFVTHDPRFGSFTSGFATRLTPARVHGSWPGLDPDLPKSRAVTAPGPVVVLTLGRFRLSQAPRFFRTSAKAEAVVAGSPGLIWATGELRVRRQPRVPRGRDQSGELRALPHAGGVHPLRADHGDGNARGEEPALVRAGCPPLGTGALTGRVTRPDRPPR